MEHNQSINYKHLAYLYFEGKISKEDGRRLRDYLKEQSEGGDHMIAFHEWKNEWLQSKGYIRPRKNPIHKNYISWKTFISIAAGFLILICLGLTCYVFSQENYYVCHTPSGGRTDVLLPDGSNIILNSSSEIKYSNHFGLSNRNVWLKGEAFFDIAKKGHSKFTVHLNSCDIVVYGTQFNISAYNEDSLITTRLFRGQIEVLWPDTSIMMQPGQQMTFDKTRHLLSLNEIDPSDRGWVENRLEAEDMRLDFLAKILSRQYGVKIYILSPELKNVSLTMHLDNITNINDIMNALKRVIPVSIQRKGNSYYIKQ